jgi:hypothetical protein
MLFVSKTSWYIMIIAAVIFVDDDELNVTCVS